MHMSVDGDANEFVAVFRNNQGEFGLSDHTGAGVVEGRIQRRPVSLFSKMFWKLLMIPAAFAFFALPFFLHDSLGIPIAPTALGMLGIVGYIGLRIIKSSSGDLLIKDVAGKCPTITISNGGWYKAKMTWDGHEGTFRLCRPHDRIELLDVDLNVERQSFHAVCGEVSSKLPTHMLIAVLYFSWVRFALNEES